jgi:hypothetical protein
MSGLLKNAFATRVSGGKPSPVRAGVAATVAGAAVAVLTYKLLRA